MFAYIRRPDPLNLGLGFILEPTTRWIVSKIIIPSYWVADKFYDYKDTWIGFTIIFVDINWDPFLIYEYKNDQGLLFLMDIIRIQEKLFGQSKKYYNSVSFSWDCLTISIDRQKRLSCNLEYVPNLLIKKWVLVLALSTILPLEDVTIKGPERNLQKIFIK